MGIVVVRGVGDVGSIVAVTLLRSGWRVVMHDRPRPPYCRRAISFTDAMFDGVAAFDDVVARYVAEVEHLRSFGEVGELAATDAPFPALIEAVKPAILVDARMRKHDVPEVQRHLAALSIGLGPNFVAGTHVDVVIETAYEARIGQVIHHGRAKDLAGEPRPLAGHGRERFVYASTSGPFRTRRTLGELVGAGEEVGRIGTHSVLAPLSGWLRGLAHDGCEVEPGNKIVEIDASPTPASVAIVGERPRRIAEGVLAAIRECRFALV